MAHRTGEATPAFTQFLTSPTRPTSPTLAHPYLRICCLRLSHEIAHRSAA